MEQQPEHFGRYQVRRLIGKGAMGMVYEGWDPLIERRVAIKVIRIPPWMTEEDLEVYRARFFNEARAAGKLQHPSIVMVYDMGIDESTGTPYLVMEYVEGTNLKKKIQEEGPLPVPRVIQIGMDVARGLAYAHRHGIVHRDIKSANILLTAERAKITDFGIAHLPHSELTRTGQVIGSPSYMAPEILHGRGAQPASDLFSLGVVLYEALTGDKPFKGNSVSAISVQILTQEPPPIESLRSGVPAELCRIVLRLLEKEPEKRFSTADELVSALERLGAGEPLQQTGDTSVGMADNSDAPTMPIDDLPSLADRMPEDEIGEAPGRFGLPPAVRTFVNRLNPRMVMVGAGILIALSFALMFLFRTPSPDEKQITGKDDSKRVQATRTEAVPEVTCPFRLVLWFPYDRMHVFLPGPASPLIERDVFPWKKSVLGPIKKVVREVTLKSELPGGFEPRLELTAGSYQHTVKLPVVCERGEQLSVRVDIPAPGAEPRVRVLASGKPEQPLYREPVHEVTNQKCRVRLLVEYPDRKATFEVSDEEKIFYEEELHARKKKVLGLITRWEKRGQVEFDLPVTEETVWFTLRVGQYQRRLKARVPCKPDEMLQGYLQWKNREEPMELSWGERYEESEG